MHPHFAPPPPQQQQQHYQQPQQLQQQQQQQQQLLHQQQQQQQQVTAQAPPPLTVLADIPRAAKISFCPSPQYPTLVALGTVTGTIDEVSYETRSALEIYDLQLHTSAQVTAPVLLGSVTTKDCFHSVAWGSKGFGSTELSHGLIAGGMMDGAVNIWSAGAIIKRSAAAGASPQISSPSTPSSSTSSLSNSALLCRSEQHKGQVLGLQFHPTQPNLLASGGGDGLVLVWDLADVKQPKANKPNPALTGVEHGVTCVGWNKKVPQILASSNDSGETTVWDLRQKKCQSHHACMQRAQAIVRVLQ